MKPLSLVLALLLLAGLTTIQPALATPSTTPLPPETSEPFGEETEEEGEAEEGCEAEEELFEEEGLCEEEGEQDPGPEAQCPLRSAKAHATTRHNHLKLTIGYTTNEPVKASIAIRIGSLQLGPFKRHLGRSGVLRFTKKLPRAHGTRLVIHVAPIGRAGCPSRRLVLFGVVKARPKAASSPKS